MKRIIVVLAVSLLLAPVFSQNVTIHDTAFLAALIEEGVDTNKDGQISYAEAEDAINLNVVDRGITNMTGVEAFVNLEELNCFANQLTSLDISNNTLLKELYCPVNQLTSLDVSKNIALEVLMCSYNQLTSLDVSKNINLISGFAIGRTPGLDCSGNLLTTLDVSNNTD